MDSQTHARPQAATTYDTPIFRLGRCVTTLEVDNLISRGDLNPHELLRRHQCGDWGDRFQVGRKRNGWTMDSRGRLMSVFNVGLETIWVITDADWATTTIQFPSGR